MKKETALHSIAMCASKTFVESNIEKYIHEKDGYSTLVSDLTAKYKEAYIVAKKELSNSDDWLY